MTKDVPKKILFEGNKYKITTNGRSFFLHARLLERKWELKDQNLMAGQIYKEALRSIKKILSLDMPEEEKILKICECGFFKISNL